MILQKDQEKTRNTGMNKTVETLTDYYYLEQ